MDPDVLSVGAILAGIFAATIVVMWHINSQWSRLESKIDDIIKELRTEICDTGEDLKAVIETHSKRVSASELERARLNGVNSALARTRRISMSPSRAGSARRVV